jgi:hypothetical protein
VGPLNQSELQRQNPGLFLPRILRKIVVFSQVYERLRNPLQTDEEERNILVVIGFWSDSAEGKVLMAFKRSGVQIPYPPLLTDLVKTLEKKLKRPVFQGFSSLTTPCL